MLNISKQDLLHQWKSIAQHCVNMHIRTSSIVDMANQMAARNKEEFNRLQSEMDDVCAKCQTLEKETISLRKRLKEANND